MNIFVELSLRFPLDRQPNPVMWIWTGCSSILVAGEALLLPVLPLFVAAVLQSSEN